MEEILNFFDGVQSPFRATILIGGMTIFWILEGIIPFYQLKYKKWKHGIVNFMFNITTMIVGFGLAGVLLYVSDYVNANGIGIYQMMNTPLWIKVLVAILLMDLIGAYFAHWTEHKVKWMWKFHLIHHTDTNVDVTTGLRHHPGETIIRIMFTILGVFVVGVPMSIVIIYQSLSIIFAHLTHANIDCFGKYDKLVSYVIVTPKMHKIHHHYEQPLTDGYFGLTMPPVSVFHATLRVL